MHGGPDISLKWSDIQHNRLDIVCSVYGCKVLNCYMYEHNICFEHNIHDHFCVYILSMVAFQHKVDTVSTMF